MRVVLVVLALAFAKERPVSKVIKLLKAMQAELGADADKDAAIYEKLGCWCETNSKEKAASITGADNAINQGVADMEKNSAKAAQLTTEIKQAETEVERNVAALEQATQVRASEAAESTQEQKDLAQSIQALENAVGVLGKHHASFLQTDTQTEANMREVKKAVKKVLSMPKRMPAHQRVLMKFVQGPPNAGSYAPQSGQIFGLLNQMKEEFEQNLSSEQSSEGTSEKDYAGLKVAKTQEISAGKQQAKAKTAQLADAKVALAQARQDVADARGVRAADVQFSQDLALQCDKKDEDYALRTKTRSEETAAISETIQILQSDDAHDTFSATLGFVQTHSARFVRGAAQFAVQQKVAQMKKAAQAAGGDVFAKVRKSIDEMVSGLKAEAGDDTKHRDACIAELHANEKSTAIKQREIDELTTGIAKAAENIASLTKQIEAHEAEAKETKKQMNMATENREAANKEFQDTVKEMRATQAVLAKALARLKEFYGFVEESSQSAEKPNAPAQFDEYKNNAGAGGVVQLLKNISEEARQMELESIKSEQDSQAAYENFIKDANDSVAKSESSIARKSGEKAEQEAAKAAADADRSTALKDAENLQSTNAALHASCDFLLQNFEARSAARTQEIEALADAKAIFSGADFA